MRLQAGAFPVEQFQCLLANGPLVLVWLGETPTPTSKQSRPIGAFWRWSAAMAIPAQERLIGVCGGRRAEVLV